MKPKSLRFGLDYVRNDAELDPESLSEGFSGEGKLFYAELSKEQKAWNAQWYSEDHNDARLDQRRFFLMYLQHNLPALTQSLYQVLPSFRRIFADSPGATALRFDFLQSMVMSFTHDYLKVGEARREEADRLIEEIVEKSLASKPDAPTVPEPTEPDPSGWKAVVVQQVHFKAMQRLLPHGTVLEETAGGVDERFAVVYRPLYRWLARWHLLEPWVADVALSTLLKWDQLAVEQARATSFAFVPRPKTAQHNVITHKFPKLEARDLAFSFSYNANWELESERFASFQDAFMQAAREALTAFKRNIDEKMLKADYVQVTGRTNVHDILPFRWLALYQVGGASFAQITEDDLRERKGQVETEEEADAFAHLYEQRQEAITKAVQRVAKRIGLTLRPTNQN